MKNFAILSVLLFTSSLLNAQYNIKIDAFVFDKDSKEPLEYVNIGFKNKTVKDISAQDGSFNLVYDEHYINDDDIFVCSLLGYQTLEVVASHLYKLLANTNRIYLEAKQKDQEDKANISGQISDGTNMLQGAKISVKNTLKEVRSDVNGQFKINADSNDVLIVSHLGMITREVLVGDRQTVDIELQVDGELLDEILLKQQAAEENEVNTGVGKKKEDALGYAHEQITADEISPAALSLADVIVGKFPGVQVVGLNVAYNSPQFIIRGGGGSILNPAKAIFVVDGTIYEDAPDFIIPQNIESITLLKSIISTNRYGSLGRGGAFLIKMKTLEAAKGLSEKGSALVKGNNYEEQLSRLDKNYNEPYYLLAYKNANTFEDAKKIFYSQNPANKIQSIPYYLDVANLFVKYNTDFALNILSKIADLAIENPKALKVLAYKYEELGNLDQAKLVYQQIAKLRPNDAQSYRDLAYIYQETGHYKEAEALYKKILRGDIKNVDFKGLLKPIENELRHLLKLHRTHVELSDFASDFTRIDFKIDLRIVFEWNDPNTEFQFQFVDPNKKFFKWEHSLFENKARMLDEIKNGYHIEEFIIDDAVSGEWMINIENFSEESELNPTYLKYTVYKNYGLENETKKVKVVKLYNQKQKVTLDSFVY